MYSTRQQFELSIMISIAGKDPSKQSGIYTLAMGRLISHLASHSVSYFVYYETASLSAIKVRAGTGVRVVHCGENCGEHCGEYCGEYCEER